MLLTENSDLFTVEDEPIDVEDGCTLARSAGWRYWASRQPRTDLPAEQDILMATGPLKCGQNDTSYLIRRGVLKNSALR